jgi:cytochrome bd-type quinol oxidase subunit 2
MLEIFLTILLLQTAIMPKVTPCKTDGFSSLQDAEKTQEVFVFKLLFVFAPLQTPFVLQAVAWLKLCVFAVQAFLADVRDFSITIK